MIVTLVAIKDVKVGAFQQPVATAAIGGAVRAFEDACKEPGKNTDMSRHPADFELYKLGTFNDETGRIECLDTPQFICGGANV